MKVQTQNILYILFFVLIVTACDSKPKVIQSETEAASASLNENGIPALDNLPELKDAVTDEHKIEVEEVLNTSKYSYLNVSENGEKFWIAVSKRDVTVGDTYYYKGGLLKKNFFSQEFNRVFETVFLVSNIWKQPTGNDAALDEAIAQQSGGHSPNLEVGNIEHTEGSIKLSELLTNKVQYNGQTVKVTGKIIKVNPMIMNRNWLHLQDGTGDKLDLTITTTESVPLGAIVSLEGTIALDKDFGAGYRYDIILEGAVLK